MLVRHTNRLTRLAGCQRFILREDGPGRGYIESLRDASHGLLDTRTRIDGLLGAITFPRASISPAGGNAPATGIDTGFGPRGQNRERRRRKKGKKVIRHRNHVPTTEDRTLRYEEDISERTSSVRRYCPHPLS